MPVSLGSLGGVDPATARALQNLAAAVNRLEAAASAASAPRIARATTDPEARSGVALAEQQIQGLLQRVTDLEARVAALEAP